MLFASNLLMIDCHFVCSIAEGCTLKLVLALRGGPINTRKGKEKSEKLYTNGGWTFAALHYIVKRIEVNFRTNYRTLSTL